MARRPSELVARQAPLDGEEVNHHAGQDDQEARRDHVDPAPPLPATLPPLARVVVHRPRLGRLRQIEKVVQIDAPLRLQEAVAKGGLIAFTKTLAREVAKKGVTVNCVAPGFIDTDMTAGLSDKQRELLLADIPMKRLGTVHDVAAAVAFLASPAAAYITGETLHVNGGMYMG